MATFYVGVKPTLRGRDADNFIHTWKVKVGVYSNYALMDTGSKLLAGFPDNEYTLGSLKHARLFEYIFAGKQHIAPMAGAGGETRLSYHRTKPLEYKGTVPAFPAGYGHASNRGLYYEGYSNFVFDGIASSEALLAAGHVRRFTTTYGGAFDPYIFKGTPSSLAMPGTVGQALPATATTSNYGHNKVNEWRGTPSSKAL